MAKREKATLSMPDTLKHKARAEAILRGKNLSQVVRELLQLWLAGKIDIPSLQEPQQKRKVSPQL